MMCKTIECLGVGPCQRDAFVSKFEWIANYTINSPKRRLISFSAKKYKCYKRIRVEIGGLTSNNQWSWMQHLFTYKSRAVKCYAMGSIWPLGFSIRPRRHTVGGGVVVAQPSEFFIHFHWIFLKNWTSYGEERQCFCFKEDKVHSDITLTIRVQWCAGWGR